MKTALGALLAAGGIIVLLWSGETIGPQTIRSRFGPGATIHGFAPWAYTVIQLGAWTLIVVGAALVAYSVIRRISTRQEPSV